MTENMSSANESNLNIDNPFDLIDHQDMIGMSEETSGQNQDVSPIATVKSEKKMATPSTGFKSLIKFLAKISGNPDPETGKSFSEKGDGQGGQIAMNTNNVVCDAVSNTTLDQDVTQAEIQKANNFDTIMSGVTGVLDKIGNKFEKITGLDLDAPIKNRTGGSNQGKSEGKNPIKSQK